MRKTKHGYGMIIGYLCVIALILFLFLATTCTSETTAYASEIVGPVVIDVEPIDRVPMLVSTREFVPENEYFDIPLSHELQDYLRTICEERGIPIEYALAIMTVENTSFEPSRVNSTHDYGLWQINIGNHDYIREQLGEDLVFTDPYDNIKAGVFWISRYYPRYGYEQAAMCYHHGEGYAKKLFRQGNTNDEYSQKVMAAMTLYL